MMRYVLNIHVQFDFVHLVVYIIQSEKFIFLLCSNRFRNKKMEKISPKKVPCKNDRKSHLQKSMLARYVQC